MKSSAEVFDAINALERRFPVALWRADDIALWPSYRFRLYGDAINRTLQNSPITSKTSRFTAIVNRAARALFRVPLAGWRDRRNNAEIEPGMNAVFFSDGVSFARMGDRWFDRVMDPLMLGLEQRGYRSLKLTPLSDAHIPRYVSSRFVQPTLDRIKLTASPRDVSLTLPQFEAFFAAADELFGGIARSASWLRLQAARLQALATWFGEVLRQTGCSHAFVNTYYSLEGQAFVLAARRLRLRSIDVQHGIQGPHHVAYGRWSMFPVEGYSTLPDEFWVWGHDEAATINSWRGQCATHLPRITGNFWLQRWRNERDPIVARYVEEARKLRSVDSNKTHVLVCLTWGVPEGETTKLLDAAKLCGPSTIFWWRLHPVFAHRSAEFARVVASHGLDSSQVEQATNLPLFALLRAADVTLAHSSTTIREAAEFGVPSIVTSDYGAELHADLVQRGFVIHATEPRSIADGVDLLSQSRNAGTAPAGSGGYSLDSVLDIDFPAIR